MPIYFGNESIQEELANLHCNQFKNTILEEEWFNMYYLDESDASLFKDMENPEKNAYKLYSFTSAEFKDRLFDAAIAKGTVGIGTTQYWAWSDAVNLYYDKYNGKTIELNGSKITLRKMSSSVREELISLYAIVLQERVIGAIKWMEGGSQGYRIFMLERLASTQSRLVLAALEDGLSFVLHDEDQARQDLKGEVISFLFYLAALFSRTRLDLFTEFSRMYSHYNGGRELDKPLKDDCRMTMFYSIVKQMDEWRSECKLAPVKTGGKAPVMDSPF